MAFHVLPSGALVANELPSVQVVVSGHTVDELRRQLPYVMPSVDLIGTSRYFARGNPTQELRYTSACLVDTFMAFHILPSGALLAKALHT